MGTLILFGAVQITIFIVSWMKGERFRKIVLIGMVTASWGVLFLLLPSASSPPLGSAVLMTIFGDVRRLFTTRQDHCESTCGKHREFRKVSSIFAITCSSHFFGNGLNMSLPGVMYALASGVLASGCGYDFPP